MDHLEDKKRFILSVEEARRLDFLTNLLLSNDSLFLDFAKKFGKTKPQPVKFDADQFKKAINENFTQFKSDLEELDFEEVDWENWHDPGYYIPDYEIAMELAQEEADAFYDGWQLELKTTAGLGNYLETLATFSGMYAAAMQAEINDPNCNVGDSANDYFIELLTKDRDANIEDDFKTPEFNSEELRALFEILFQFAKSTQPEVIDFVAKFLVSLIRTGEDASAIIYLMEQHELPKNISPFLSDHLIFKTGNIEEWLKMSEEIFPDNFDLAIKLLDYYREHLPQKFEEKALVAYVYHQQKMREYLMDKLTEGGKLYCRFWMDDAKINYSIESYNKARKHLSREEAISYAKGFRSIPQIITILKQEDAFDEVLNMARENRNSNVLLLLIQPILNIYPEECFQIIHKQANETLKFQKNREGYKVIAALLKTGLNIPDHKERINLLINQYFNHNPRLPALRDEFKKAGLV